jgi:hypothetical protein
VAGSLVVGALTFRYGQGAGWSAAGVITIALWMWDARG